MKRYLYYCTQRPAGPGAIPRGAVEIEDMDPNIPVLKNGKSAYSLVAYNRQLTEEEIRDYELTWAYTELIG